MALEIIDVRKLTDKELYFFELARQVDLISCQISRREALMAIGGGALAAAIPMSLIPQIAHAQSRELVYATIQGAIQLSKGTFHQQEPIGAKFNLANETASIQRKPVYNAIRTAQLGITDQDYTYVHLAPRAATTVRHSGFLARTRGQNDYLAKTQIDAAEQGFDVR